jgi:hypothetical protein
MPKHQLASRTVETGSSSHAPLSQVEANSGRHVPPSLVAQLQQDLKASVNERGLDAAHILELLAEKKQLQKQLAEQRSIYVIYRLVLLRPQFVKKWND